MEALEAEQVAEQARLDSEQEAIRLRMNDAAEAIARVRETLAGTEQRQSQALTAAEVERNRTELFERQRVQASQEMERLAADREQAQGEIEALRATLLQLDGDIAEQETQFQQAARAGRPGNVSVMPPRPGRTPLQPSSWDFSPWK